MPNMKCKKSFEDSKTLLIKFLKYKLILFSLLSALSCSEVANNKTLVDDITQLNRNCPLSAGKIGTLNYAEIEDSCVVLHYYLTEEMKNIAWGCPNAVFDEKMQYLEIAMLDTANLKEEPLTKLYYDAFQNGYSIKNKYNFTFDNGIDADVATTLLTPKTFYDKYLNGDIKRLCNESLKIRQINENRIYASQNLPDSLRSYDIIEDTLFVIGACVSSKDFVNVWFNQFELRKKLLRAFKDPSMINFAKQCITCDKGIGFRYVSIAKNDSINIIFSQKELVKIISNFDEVMETYNMVEKSEVQDSGSGAEKAALFCSVLMDLAKIQDYNKAKSLMKNFVNDYVTEFYSDGSVYLNDDRYEECKEFCVSFQKNMTQEVWIFLSSDEMKSEIYTQFQLMSLAGLQAAEDDSN